MDSQQIGTKLTFDALGLPLQIQTFEDRLIAQKTICLAQAAGIQLGYHFGWYLRGPYSPGLTRDLFSVSEAIAEGSDESGTWKFDEQSLVRVRQISPLFKCESRTALASKLELLASTGYLISQGRVSARDVSEIQKVLENFGKRFPVDQVSAGVKDLIQHGLVPAPLTA